MDMLVANSGNCEEWSVGPVEYLSVDFVDIM